MAELYSPEDLPHVLPGPVLPQALAGPVLQFLQDSAVHVLKDEVELASAAEHLDEVDQVLVAEALEWRKESLEDWRALSGTNHKDERLYNSVQYG